MKRRVLLFGAFALIILLLGSRVGLFKESQVVSNPVELKPEGVSDRDWSHFLQAHDIRKASNREIRFFGKVVDQYGNPIEGVEVPTELVSRETSLLKVMSNGKDQNTESRIFKTDVNGLFFIGNKVGFALSIKDFIKEGYLRPRGVETTYMFGQIMKDPNSSEFHKADSKKPVTYVMWKKGEAEPLIKTRAKLWLDKSKGVEAIHILFDRKNNISNEVIPEWDIKLTGWNRNFKEWSYTLKACEGGGVVLNDDVHSNLAPQNGYENSITFTSEQKSNSTERKIYFHNKEKTKYVSLHIHHNLYAKGNLMVSFDEIKINPAGSRNLEYDKSKRIRK